MSTSRRIRLRPDRASLRVLVAVVALALAAVNYESNTAWLLACLVAALAMVSALHARGNLRGVVLRPLPADPVFAGDQIPITIEILSTGTPALALHLAVGTGHASATGVAADCATRLQVLHPGLARGYHRLAAPELRSSYPLGMVQARMEGPATIDVLVYPRPQGRALGDATLVGEGTGDGVGGLDGGDFAGHRSWQPGDNQRRVDWRALARGRPLLVKQFAGSSAECLLDWDATEGDDETRLSQLTRWVLDAHTMGWRFGLHLPGRTIPPGTGDEQRSGCLRALALFGMESA